MTEAFVIIEKLKALINNRKIRCALFYTFNFDARFFENYLLPAFVPHVNFSDIEIQNSILWRKYASDLPPITVYCDFHAKTKDAPSLAYTVRTVDIKTRQGKKPCFHPKNSFILLDDNSLIVLTGSNNLSVSGWCLNTESLSALELKSNEFFPYALKHEIRSFMYAVLENFDEPTEEEDSVFSFLNQRKHTNDNHIRFFSSYRFNPRKLLDELHEKNNYNPFKKIEIISPYLSSRNGLIRDVAALITDQKIKILVPYSATNLASITKQLHEEFQESGVVWSRMIKSDEDKIYRFNHSKVYRLLGVDKMFTIVGSANFTEAGWSGFTSNGNIESMVLYEEPASLWSDWLIEHNNPNLIFPQIAEEEAPHEQRHDVPDMSFTLDWAEKTLQYNNLKRTNFKGLIMLPEKNHEVTTGKNIEIKLSETQIAALADNSIIKTHEYHTQREFFFFPIIKNNASRPYSTKLKLNDQELLNLWKNVSLSEHTKSEISDLIERYIESRLDREGELLNRKITTKSTMNTMASHMSALIKLEERIFHVPQRKTEYERAKEMLEYYIFTNNIDTLAGYRKLLHDMQNDQAILPAVCWFLLNIVNREFYDKTKINRFYRNINIPGDGLQAKVNKQQEDILNEMKSIKRLIKRGEVNDGLYKWIKNQLER